MLKTLLLIIYDLSFQRDQYLFVVYIILLKYFNKRFTLIFDVNLYMIK